MNADLHEAYEKLTTGDESEQSQALEVINQNRAKFFFRVVLPIILFWGAMLGGVYLLMTGRL